MEFAALDRGLGNLKMVFVWNTRSEYCQLYVFFYKQIRVDHLLGSIFIRRLLSIDLS